MRTAAEDIDVRAELESLEGVRWNPRFYEIPLGREDVDLLRLYFEGKASKLVVLYGTIISRFAEFAYNMGRTLTSIRKMEALRWFRDLDSRLKYKTKITYWGVLRGFYLFVEEMVSDYNKDFTNPIPSTRAIRFTADPVMTQAEKEIKLNDQYYSLDQMKAIFAKVAQVREDADFAWYTSLLCAFTGARPSEVISIKLENLDLTRRYFKSGLVVNCKKKGEVDYCIPEEIAVVLQGYVEEVRDRLPGNEWLIPGFETKNGHGNRSFISYTAVHHRLAELGLPFHVHLHSFRRTMISTMLNRVNHVPPMYVTMLLHHKFKGNIFGLPALSLDSGIPEIADPTDTTTWQVYNKNKDVIDYRRALYDEYLPREHRELLAWLKRLYF